jgi:RTX calcium-binding nonapeptide repeat (4 copies)
MAKFIAKSRSVDNSDLNGLDGFIPNKGTTIVTLTIGPDTYERSSVYKNGELTVKWYNNGLIYTLKTEVSPKELKTVFKGDSWEQKFFKGGDKIKGSTDGDMLYGFNGSDTIQGRSGDDAIYGGKGKDTIHGDEGANTLYGGAGKDAFVFDSVLMPGNNSHVADFKIGKDTMQLDRSVFDGVGKKGTLKGAKFFTADEYAGQKKAVIYDKDVGTLSYSKHGGDMSNAVAFGSVTAGLDLGHKDFLVV